jgi:type II secretory pathway component GspD/PulD (secretin)
MKVNPWIPVAAVLAVALCVCAAPGRAHAQDDEQSGATASGDGSTWEQTLDESGPNLRAQPKRLRDYHLPGLDNIVNLKSIEPWDVIQLIEFLAYRGGLNNIVIGNSVAGLATKLKFENVTVGEALEVVLSVNNLAYEVNGDIITIMTDKEYEDIHGVSFYDQKQVRIVQLRYADATRVAGMLGSIKSDIGTVVADPLTGTLILIDTPEKILEMRGVIDSADMTTVGRVIPTEIKFFVLNHADVETMLPEVEKLLTREVGTVQGDPRTKTLIVSDLPHNMPRVAELIRLFDKPPRQVFIEAKILEVSLSDQYQLGVNWNAVFDGVNPRFQLDGTVRRPILGPDNPGIGALTYRTILGTGGDLEVMVEALKTVGQTKILSNPHVAVVDGEEASIKVVQDTPYAETSVEVTGSDTNFVGEEIRFIEVGVILTVTPRIGDDGFINMAIRPEVSSASYDYQAFRRIPVVQRTYSETTVMIKDGETIIIAGMIQNSKQEVEQRVPILGRIPLIGMLFKSSQDELSTRELVVFLTPRIMSGEEPVLRLQDMRKRPKPLRSTGVQDKSKSLKPVR